MTLSSHRAEEAVLGAILINPACMSEVASVLRGEPGDLFADEQNAAVYEAMVQLQMLGDPIDEVTVYEKLIENGQDLGIVAHLGHVAGVVPVSDNATAYARTVRDYAVRRALQWAGHKVQERSQDLTRTPSEVIEAAVAEMPVQASGGASAATQSMDSMVDGVIAELDDTVNGRKEPSGIMTGFDALDHKLHGLQPGNMIVLAARPSVGKTALALNLAYRAATAQSKSVLMFSLEMSAQQLIDRLLCIAGGVDTHRIREGWESERQLARLRSVAEAVRHAPIWVNDTVDVSFADIKTICSNHAAVHGLDLVVVDYLQLMTPRDRRESRQVDVADLSRAMKALARSMNIPVLVLSQLSRGADDSEPRLSHLRESGAIEQDADVVITLSRGENDAITLDVAKHRNGPTGKVAMRFEQNTQRFMQADAVPVGEDGRG